MSASRHMGTAVQHLAALAILVALGYGVAAADVAATVLEQKGRWESGYGSTWYNVVGRLRNDADHAVRWVKLRLDALDATGAVVASTDTYNESAEVLTVPDVDGAALLQAGKVPTLAAHAEERFRASFLKDETPDFVEYRVTVVEAPAVP